MLELVEIAENKDFADRVFPVILSDARISDPVDRLDYVEFWEAEKARLNQRIKSLSDVSNLQGINEELNNYDRFRDRSSGLATTLKDMNMLTPDMHRNSDFSELYATIGKRMQEGPSTAAAAAPAQNESKPAESAKPAVTNVTASNNSVALGGIQIGGSVNGNISIGNNNQK